MAQHRQRQMWRQPLKAILGIIPAALIGACAPAEAQQLSEVADTASGGTPRRAADGVVRLAETVLDALTVDRDHWSLAIYPAASYSSRSGLAVGVMPMLQINTGRLPKPATITPAVLISTKRMFEVQCDADVFLPRRVDLTAKVEAYRQPDDLYEPGNQKGKRAIAEYDFNRLTLYAELLKGLGETGPWRIGAALDVDHYSFSNISPQDDSLSDRVSQLTGTGAGDNFGLGLAIGYDTRDDALWPRRGAYTRLKAIGYGRLGDRGHKFCAITLDVRRYVPIGDNLALALQGYADIRCGHAPFTKMATCGGTRLGRAVGHNLKYLGRGAWLAQAELRAPLFWRIGATAFGALGNVTDNAGGTFTSVHAMCGAGLRLAVFPGKGLNLRLDGGVSSRGDKAIYFNIREAF